MNTNDHSQDMSWPEERVFPLMQSAQQLDVYDVRSASHAVKLSIATLVGLINRPQPRVYLIERNHDAFWLKEAFSSLPQTISPLTQAAILRDLLTKYRSLVQGLIMYEPALLDTSNIATMLAAQRNGIAVTPEQAEELQHEPFNLPILTDLRAYGWSTHLQAYKWAIANLRSGASPRLVAGLDPKIAVGIRPFLVATRAFIYWLNPLSFLPDPKVGLLSERSLMQQIMHSYAPNTATHFGWFIQEGSGVSITSRAAIPVFATDHYSNLEVWGSVPDARPVLPEPQPNTRTPEVSKTYISFTMSEGDNLQYVQEHMLTLWQDAARGTVPIGWPIPPVLLEAAPPLLDYYVRTATPADEFLAGPSGVGYMYPAVWPAAHLTPFLIHSGRLMQSTNLKALEVLDSNFRQNVGLAMRAILKGAGMAMIDQNLQRRYAEELKAFGVHGILSGSGQKSVSWRHFSGVPIYQNLGLISSVSEALSMIKKAIESNKERPLFLNLYILAWKMTPSDLKQLSIKLGEGYEIVTPGEMLRMIAKT